jgi:hypothetical protein
MYQKLPSDPFITEMDPVLKMWLYEQWLGDHRDNAELAKNHAYLLGSFTNPEAVQQLMSNAIHESSDEDMEESLKMVSDFKLPQPINNEKVSKKRRKKATLIPPKK